MIFAQRPSVLGLRDGPKSGISSGNVTPFAIFLTFCALGENVGSHKKNWNPGKSIICIYICVLSICRKCPDFLPRVQNAERLVTKALARFGSLFCTPWKWCDFTKRYYIKLSFTCHIVMNWNEVWEVNETLLYKGIIHLSRSTANHENDQNQRKALVVCCSVFQKTDLWKSRKRE